MLSKYEVIITYIILYNTLIKPKIYFTALENYYWKSTSYIL